MTGNKSTTPTFITHTVAPLHLIDFVFVSTIVTRKKYWSKSNDFRTKGSIKHTNYYFSIYMKWFLFEFFFSLTYFPSNDTFRLSFLMRSTKFISRKLCWFMASIHKTIAPFKALKLKTLILQANTDLEREEIL